MGKAENIKRAKRLKEAKRKREQDVLMAAGLGSGAKTLMQRIEGNGKSIVLLNDKVKYSELLKEFVSPIIDPLDEADIIKTKYMVGAHAWNTAIMKEKSEELYLLAKQDVLKIAHESAGLELLFDEFVKRKQEDFGAHKSIIVDFEITKFREGDYDLTVATAPINSL